MSRKPAALVRPQINGTVQCTANLTLFDARPLLWCVAVAVNTFALSKKSCFFLFSFCDHKRNFLPIKGSSDKSLYSLNFGLSPLH